MDNSDLQQKVPSADASHPEVEERGRKKKSELSNIRLKNKALNNVL